jgi:hypothetical protein
MSAGTVLTRGYPFYLLEAPVEGRNVIEPDFQRNFEYTPVGSLYESLCFRNSDPVYYLLAGTAVLVF